MFLIHRARALGLISLKHLNLVKRVSESSKKKTENRPHRVESKKYISWGGRRGRGRDLCDLLSRSDEWSGFDSKRLETLLCWVRPTSTVWRAREWALHAQQWTSREIDNESIYGMLTLASASKYTHSFTICLFIFIHFISEWMEEMNLQRNKREFIMQFR